MVPMFNRTIFVSAKEFKISPMSQWKFTRNKRADIVSEYMALDQIYILFTDPQWRTDLLRRTAKEAQSGNHGY